MIFNNWVNFGIALAGILNFLGVFGGLAFLVYWIDACIDEYKSNKADSKENCETCIAYKACFGAFGGHLPEDGCAYYKSDKEVEISAK